MSTTLAAHSSSRSTVRRVLITLPWADCPSNILLRSLIDDAHAGDISWLVAENQPASDRPFHFEPVRWNLQPFSTFRVANSLAFRLKLYPLADALTFGIRMGQCADELAAAIRNVRPEVLWAVATPQQVVILDRLLDRLAVPLHLSIHDDPESSARINSRWPYVLKWAVREAWPRVVRHAASIDTVSLPMREYVRSRHGRDSIVLSPAPQAPLIESPPAATNGRLHLGISGSWFNLEKPLLALATGLRRAVQTGVVKELKLFWLDGQRAVCHRPVQHFQALLPPNSIAFLPRQSESEAIRTLAACHANYLPFWYPDDVMRQTSNPSKLRLFLPAARPIIVHGPDDCMPVRFAREHGVGVVWNNLDPNTFPEVLVKVHRQLEQWPEHRARYQALFDWPLSIENNRARFWQTIEETRAGQRTA